MATTEKRIKRPSPLGQSVIRLDGEEKVTGKFIFGADVSAQGMLHAKIRRADIPHGRITRLDVAKARALPGVHAVLTQADVPDVMFGTNALIEDEYVFAKDIVRFEGQAIAAVAAETAEIAREACDLIEVEYEPLPIVETAYEGAQPGAPILHPDLDKYLTAPGILKGGGNIPSYASINLGDVDAGFAEADFIIEDEFQTQFAHQGYIENRSGLSKIANDGTVHAQSSTQFPHGVVNEMAKVLDLPLNKVRLESVGVGGGFGGKLELTVEHYTGLLARATGRPVKLCWTREEELRASSLREAVKMRVKTGFMKDGRIVARESWAYLDAGAYGGETLLLGYFPPFLSRGAYNIPNVRGKGTIVYTNKTNMGAFRGVTGVPVYYAIESHMDHIARKLNMDPVELRRKNLLKDGDLGPSKQPFTQVSVGECLDAVTKALAWEKPKAPASPGKLRGRGVACGWWMTTGGPSGAYVKLNLDGSIDVLTGAKEIGSGALTTGIAQLVAAELVMDVTDVRFTSGDTATTPYDMGAQGSRTTANGGAAVIEACKDFKKQMFDKAAKMLECTPEDLVMDDHQIHVAGADQRSVTFKEIAVASTYSGELITGRGAYIHPMPTYDAAGVVGSVFPAFPNPSFHAHGVEVEVDPETGEVNVLRYVAAQDVGFAINPMSVRGQIAGGVVQGIGYALWEEVVYKAGKVLNPNLTDYKLPLAPDLPPIECIIIENPGEGPYGIKGVAEPPILLPAAAIANAVQDATGVLITELPMTPERVLSFLNK